MAPSTPSTTLAAMMASRNSLPQSSLARRLRARDRALRTRFVAAHFAAGIDQHGHQRLAAFSPARLAIDQQGLGGAADAGAPHLGVEHDLLRHVGLGAWRRHRHGRCLPDARIPARALPPARARPGSCRRAARSRRYCRTGPASIAPTASRSRIGTSWIASSGSLATRRPARQSRMDRARRTVRIRTAAQDRGIAGLQAERAGIGGDIGAAFIDRCRPRRAACAPARWSCRSAVSISRSPCRPDLSASPPISSPLAIASTRFLSSASRSRKAGVAPAALASARSAALAARISRAAARMAFAIAVSALSFCAVGASASARAALRARTPISCHQAGDIARSRRI